MKKMSFLLAFFVMLGLGLQAQSDCSHKKEKVTASVSSEDGGQMDAAAKLASLDENIERRVSEENGEVTYVRKKTCAHSGKVSYVNVSYDAENGEFVNVSPKDMDAGKKGCCAAGKKAGKACCAKKASAGGEGCGSKKASATKTAADAPSKENVKLVKAEEGS